MEIPFDSPTPTGVMCTWQQCPAGHKWPMELAVSKCPGCRSDIVATRLTLCPICNEPPTLRAMRVDHIATGAWIGKECQGEQGKGESVLVEMNCERR